MAQYFFSLFAGSQDVFHNPPSENGRANISMVGLKMEPCVVPHCHLMPSSITQSQQKHQAQRKLSIACLVCFLFMVGEVIGGYLAHSLAIMTDAAHLLTDMGSMGVSLFSLWVSTRPATKTMSFGWHRSETLGALASVLSIWIVTGVLVYLASARIISNDYEIEASVMLGLLGWGKYLTINSDSPHGLSIPTHDNTSVRAAFVHVVGDLLQSIGVFVAATVIYFKPQCKIADPVSTFLFSIFVLGSTLTILRDVFRVLMEGTPRGVEFQAVKETLLSVKGVKQVHNLHLWALTLSHHISLSQFTTDPTLTFASRIRSLLQSKFGFFSCTIQVEHYLDDMATCHQCLDPQD
uniref:Probable proton-coupled zinc antiporter SLC30A3 n=1 Tax=Pseudonaja textilis TaxID=8673 RepID=A0A670YVV0_PSETE